MTTGNLPRVQDSRPTGRKRRRPLFETALIFILRHKKAVITTASCLLLACIVIPVAVYAAGASEQAQSNPDFELLETAPVKTDIKVSEFSNVVTLGSTKENPSEKDTESRETVPEVSEETETEVAPETEAPTETILDNATPVDTEAATEEPETSKDDAVETESTTVAETEPAEVEPEAPAEFMVTINFYDRESITCITGPATLYEIFAIAGYTIRDTDSISFPLDQVITEETSIMIDTVEYATDVVTEAIPFEVETYDVQTIPRGTTQTISHGQNGSLDKVYTVKRVNGVEVERTYEYEYIATYPANQIDYYGTGGTFTAPDGNTYSYSYYATVRATYYDIHGITASGLHTAPGIIATDPSVFPLGTQMYVINSTFDMGVMTAADTGGAVKGHIIDIWMDETSPHFAVFAEQGIWEFTAYVLD